MTYYTTQCSARFCTLLSYVSGAELEDDVPYNTAFVLLHINSNLMITYSIINQSCPPRSIAW